MGFKKSIPCFLLMVLVIHQTIAKNIDNEEELLKTRENIVTHDAVIDADEKSQIYTVIDADYTTKKPGIIENIVNKLSALKPKPITIQNPLKKPLHDLQEYLKPKPAPVVTKTKTVKLEVTKFVTKHPICVASVQKKPACSVIKHNSISYRDESEELSRENVAEKVEEILSEIVPKIEPTAALRMPEDISTSFFESEPDNEVVSARSGRFLQFNRETPAIDEVKSVINDAVIDASSEIIDDNDEGRYLFKGGETKTVTKTLWVTKVQSVTDYKVTATLVPENCVPLDLYFPQCPNVLTNKPLWKEEEGKNNEGA